MIEAFLFNPIVIYVIEGFIWFIVYLLWRYWQRKKENKQKIKEEKLYKRIRIIEENQKRLMEKLSSA